MVGDVRLRPMRWWDVAAVAELEREIFGAGAWSAETFWSELAQNATRSYVVAESAGDRLIGYAGISVAGAEADVHTIAVAARDRRRGVGDALLTHLVGLARERGASSLVLEVRAGNDAAIELYRRHGFERIAVRRGYYQPENEDAWVMRRRPLSQKVIVPGRGEYL